MTEKNIPLVSVVVPCYNHEGYVEETIESILNQTYENIELIVIDDGSKDNSVSVIQKLADKHGFVFVYRSNKGLPSTLNEGIKLSKGKYFCACASDDIYMLDKIEKQVKFMEDNPEYGMCYGKMISFDDKGNQIKLEINNAKSGWVLADLLICKFYITAPSAMVKKEVFNIVGDYDESLFIEDYDMWLRVSEKYRIGYINEYLVCYREHATSMSKKTFKMYQAQKTILNKWSRHISYHKALNYWHVVWFSGLSKQYKREALKYFLQSMPFLFMDTRVIKGVLKLLFFWNKKS